MSADGGKTRTVWAVQLRNPWRSADPKDSYLGSADPRWTKCTKVERYIMSKQGSSYKMSGKLVEYKRDGGGNNGVDTSIVDGIAWYPFEDWSKIVEGKGFGHKSPYKFGSFKLPPKNKIKFSIVPVCAEVMEAIVLSGDGNGLAYWEPRAVGFGQSLYSSSQCCPSRIKAVLHDGSQYVSILRCLVNIADAFRTGPAVLRIR